MNLKEGEKLDEYLDLAEELKKLWIMKVTVIPIVVRGTNGKISKEILKSSRPQHY